MEGGQWENDELVSTGSPESTIAYNLLLLTNFKYMADKFDDEILDTFREHRFHQENHTDCSECFKQDKKLEKERRLNTDRLREELGIDNSGLKNLDYHLESVDHPERGYW